MQFQLQARARCILLCACSLGATQFTLQTCGDENSDITCPFFFFEKLDKAFRKENVLYTLKKSFFPSQGSPPALFDVDMTLIISSVPNSACNDSILDFNLEFGESSRSPETSDEPIFSPHLLHWEHVWSKTILGFIIERENLMLLQYTNFLAFLTGLLDFIDTSVFSKEDNNLKSNSDNNASLALSGIETLDFLLTIDSLPCRPDDDVLLTAWEDILPWVSSLYSFLTIVLYFWIIKNNVAILLKSLRSGDMA